MNEVKTMRILREANGYSQEYVGSILGIEQNTYSKLETGKIRLTIDRIKKLSELYNVDPYFFVEKDLPIINYNTGKCSKGIINAETFNESEDFDKQKELYQLLLKEKDEQIKILKEELSELRKAQQDLLKLLEKLSKKL